MLDLSHVFASFPVLHTERFTLRANQLEDAPALFHFLSDPQVVRYLSQHPMMTSDEAAERVKMLQEAFVEQSAIAWVIVPRDTGQVIGTFGIWNFIHAHHRAEIGYTLSQDWWRKGVMTEAASGALDYAFNTMRLHSIEARTDPENTPSRRLLEKLGFVQEGYFHEDYFDPVIKKFVDTTVFSLLESAWLKRKSP